MSCSECENNPVRGAFYRWKNANVEIIACKQHWLEIREVLTKAQRNEGKLHSPSESEISEAFDRAAGKEKSK